MRNYVFFVLLIIPLSAAVAAKNTTSDDSPKIFNASLIPDVALFGRNRKITGFTLSIWGENEQDSFALGFVNGFRGNSAGVGFGLVNYGESYTGGLLSIVNYMKKDFVGLQWAFLNYVGGTVKGVQLGAVNYAGTIKGVQIGFVNYARRAESGIQVGLANIISENKVWFGQFPKAVAPAMILANWSF
jgi:hypothetical protein